MLEHQQDLIEAELAQEAELKDQRPLDTETDTISKEDLKGTFGCLNVMASENPTQQEESQLRELKEDIAEFKTDIEELEVLSKVN